MAHHPDGFLEESEENRKIRLAKLRKTLSDNKARLVEEEEQRKADDAKGKKGKHRKK